MVGLLEHVGIVTPLADCGKEKGPDLPRLSAAPGGFDGGVLRLALLRFARS